MCRASDSPGSVEPTITKKYTKHDEPKTFKRGQLE